MKNNIVYYIPAKKNSVRLPGKNFLELSGKPLYQHSTDFALHLANDIGGETILHTDNEEIKDNRFKIVNTGRFDLDSNKLQLLSIAGNQIENDTTFILLQPTSPIRDYYNVKMCILQSIMLDVGFRSVAPIKNPIIAKGNSFGKRIGLMETGSFFVFKLKHLHEGNRLISGDCNLLPFIDISPITDIDDIKAFEKTKELLK